MITQKNKVKLTIDILLFYVLNKGESALSQQFYADSKPKPKGAAMVKAFGTLKDWVEQGVLPNDADLMEKINATFGRTRELGGVDTTSVEYSMPSHVEEMQRISFASSALLCQFASMEPWVQQAFEEAVRKLFRKYSNLPCIALEVEQGETKLLRLDIERVGTDGLLFRIPNRSVKWRPQNKRRAAKVEPAA